MKTCKMLVCCAFASSVAQAAYVHSGTTKVQFLSSYSQYGNGDVIFKVEQPVTECVDGYWFSKNDPGYQANMAMLIAAFQAKTPIVAVGLSDQLWSGSVGKYCKLYSIDFRQ